MKAALKATLDATMEQWLEDNDGHPDRPAGAACPDLAEMMADAAAAVYEASHAGYSMGYSDASP